MMVQAGLIIAVTAAVFNFGVIHESNGSVSHRFVLHNDNATAVRICQTYPSCECTTIACDTGWVAPHDSVAVDVTFAPYNRGGDFYETASLVVASQSDTAVVRLTIEGTVVTSAETLMKQYPVRRGNLRLTADTLNMGEVRRGEAKTMYVGAVRDLRTDRRQSVPVTFTADEAAGWGAVSKTMRVRLDGHDQGKGGDDEVSIVVNAIVIPKFADNVPPAALPRISCPRRISRSAGELSVGNDGSAPLTVYRAYADNNANLTGTKPLTIAAGQHCAISLSRLPKDARRVTLITSDRSRPRVNVLIVP